LLVLLAGVSAQWLVELVLREFLGWYYRYDYSSELLGAVVFVIGVVGLRQADMRAVHFAPEDEAVPVAQGLRAAYPHSVTQGSAVSEAGAAATPEFLAPTELGPAEPDLAEQGLRAAAPAPDPLVMERIRCALVDDRLFQNPTLTLAELSAHTGLPPRLISFTVNAGFGRSFNDLVNGYRVAEVQRRLAAPDARRFTLLGIAFESGFNSKTTFNRIFKQVTGVAPRDYQA